MMRFLRRLLRSEERRVGKSVDLGVTGVQTCALPIWLWRRPDVSRPGPRSLVLVECFADTRRDDALLATAIEIGRASCRKECRSRCDWSSDVCTSDLALASPRREPAGTAKPCAG